MTIDRRQFGLSALALTFASAASASDSRAQYPELEMAVVPAENATGVLGRYEPFVAYLSRELGVKVTIRAAQDYAGVIEGQRAGKIHLAYFGSAAFARARLTGVKTEAFAISVDADGTKSYRSVFYVLASSPFKAVEDLKGKVLGLVDPNSTSGNNVPRFELNKRGITPETFFSKVIFTGSHENAVLALSQGTVDVVPNSWTNADDSVLRRMLTKGLLKRTDGTAMVYEDFRIILTSDPIINGPYAYLESLPDDLKAAIRTAFFSVAEKDKAAFDRLSDGKRQPWAPATTSEWDGTIELIKFVDTLRKKGS